MSKIKNTKTYETNDGRKVEEFDLDMTLYDANADESNTSGKTIKEMATPEQIEAMARRVASGEINNKIVVRGDEDAGKGLTKKNTQVENVTQPKIEPAKPREETTEKTSNNNTIVRR